MAVGGVGGRGGGRGPKGVGGKPASGSGFSGRVSGNDAAGKAESLVGASRAAGTSEAGGVGGASGAKGPAAAAPADPITAAAQGIAKALMEGKIASKQEATQQLVQLILKDKGLLGKNGKTAKKLVDKIADTLTDDPRLSAALERTWSRTGKQQK